MIALVAYLIALFAIGLGNAIVTYHILRYRDTDDNSGVVLAVYYCIVAIILIGTAVSVQWTDLPFLIGNTL